MDTQTRHTGTHGHTQTHADTHTHTDTYTNFPDKAVSINQGTSGLENKETRQELVTSISNYLYLMFTITLLHM